MEKVDTETRDEALKTQTAIRCAKAMALISSYQQLKHTNAISMENEEKELFKRENADLKMKLARERMRRRRIKLCSLTELILQVTVVLSLSSFLLVLAYSSL